MGTKFTSQLRLSQKAFIYHRGNQELPEPMPGSLGNVSNQGEGTAGRNPRNRIWVVSNPQVCLGREILWLGSRVIAQGSQLGQAGFIPDKAENSQNQGQQLQRHHLKMGIKSGL